MSTSPTNGATTPTSFSFNVFPTSAPASSQGSSLEGLGDTLRNSVHGFQEMVLKVYTVVQKVFAEILKRLSLIVSGFDLFSVCMKKMGEAFGPTPIASPDLGTTLKQILASLNISGTPTTPMGTPTVL
jgi:hypothetical protein